MLNSWSFFAYYLHIILQRLAYYLAYYLAYCAYLFAYCVYSFAYWAYKLHINFDFRRHSDMNFAI